MLGLRTIRRRMFAAIFVVALLPAAAALLAAALLLGEAGTSSGTLGPWDAVAASGDALIDRALQAAPDDSALARAAEEHRGALSESLRRSRLWSFVTGRFTRALPGLLIASVLLVGLAAFAAAALLARSFAGPVTEMVDWTGRIARSEPLPGDGPGAGRGPREFEQLRGALRSMASELDQGRRRAVEQARLRAWTDMARRVAHDLKNPLTPMRMAAAQIARGEDERTRASAEVLMEEIGRLDELARSFASLGRPPDSPRAPVDLGELLSGLARRHATEEVPIVVHADAPAMVEGHLDLLERVFRNLLVNAVEASEACSRDGTGRSEALAIHVRLGGSNGHVRVSVEDRGPGLPQGAGDAIWLPDVTTKRRGTGLGLAIVRQGVEVHGGTVRARNRDSGGAVFEVNLPAGG